MIGSALICLPLTMEPLIQGFEVVGSLFILLDKSYLVSMILVTSVSAISIVVILVTVATTVAVFGGSFEGLDFLFVQAVNSGHVHLSKACLFIRSPVLFGWAKLIGIEYLLIFTNSIVLHAFTSDLLALV